MPYAQTKTSEEEVENTRAAIGLHVETRVEDGREIPAEDIFIKPIKILARRPGGCRDGKVT